MQLTKSYQLLNTISTTYGGIRIYGKYTSQSSTDNTTSYSIQQRYYVSSSWASVSFDSATGVVDGKSKKYTSRTTMKQGETVVQTVNRTITHNEDGSTPTKTISQSWTATFGGGGSGSASITFPNITRMSIPTLNQPGTNIPLFEIGDTIRLYTNRPVNTYKHTLYININGNPVLIGSNITDYIDIETNLIANQIYQAYPNNNRITGTFTLYTYNGATLVGSANCDYLTYIRSIPTFTVGYKDTNATTKAITNNDQQIIQNKSTLQINITNASITDYAGSLSSVSVDINGDVRTETITGTTNVSKNINWGIVNLSQNTNAKITLTDSRGNSTTQTMAITMLGWQKPTADITLQRQQNFYTATDLTVDANYSSLDSKNTITITYYTKKSTDANYGAGTTIQDNTLTTFNADNLYAWDVKIVVQDSLGSSTYTRQLGIGIPIMFIDRDKHSIGVNCFPVGSNTLEVNGVNVIERNIMTAQNSTTTTTGSNTYDKIPLELKTSVGTKLTIDSTNKGVKIGSGVSYIKASGLATFGTRAGTSRHQLLIYRNTTIVSNAITRLDGNWETIVLNEILVPVSQNDIIYLYVRTQDSSGAVVDTANLTVEVVE